MPRDGGFRARVVPPQAGPALRPYARALCGAATRLDDLREAVTTLEDTERTTRRVLGGTHPMAVQIDESLQEARAHLRALETPPPGDD